MIVMTLWLSAYQFFQEENLPLSPGQMVGCADTDNPPANHHRVNTVSQPSPLSEQFMNIMNIFLSQIFYNILFFMYISLVHNFCLTLKKLGENDCLER